MTNLLVTKILVLVCVSHLVLSHGEDPAKRILLSDPDIAISKLTQIEKTLQDLTRTTNQLQTELSQERMRTTNLETQLIKATQDHGSTYIRWGRKQCSAIGTEMIYSGFTAGQEHYRASRLNGGPANILCLPKDPELSNRTAPRNSYIAGSEYEDGDFFKKGAQNEDVPCALCRSQNTSTSIMIPGKRTCYPGGKLNIMVFLPQVVLTIDRPCIYA